MRHHSGDAELSASLRAQQHGFAQGNIGRLPIVLSLGAKSEGISQMTTAPGSSDQDERRSAKDVFIPSFKPHAQAWRQVKTLMRCKRRLLTKRKSTGAMFGIASLTEPQYASTR